MPRSVSPAPTVLRLPARPAPEVHDGGVHGEVREAKVELVEDDRTKLVEAGRVAMHTELLSGDALELRGVHIRLLAEAVGATVLREVGKHEVDL